MNEPPPRKRATTGYCGYNGVVIEGTKSIHPRGDTYDLVVILPNGKIAFGHEEGNYAGGIYLSPGSDNYQIRRDKMLNSIEEHDTDFYQLIKEELEKQ